MYVIFRRSSYVGWMASKTGLASLISYLEAAGTILKVMLPVATAMYVLTYILRNIERACSINDVLSASAPHWCMYLLMYYIFVFSFMLILPVTRKWSCLGKVTQSIILLSMTCLDAWARTKGERRAFFLFCYWFSSLSTPMNKMFPRTFSVSSYFLWLTYSVVVSCFSEFDS